MELLVREQLYTKAKNNDVYEKGRQTIVMYSDEENFKTFCII